MVTAVFCAVAVLLLGACGTQVAGRGASASPTGPIPWTTAQPSAVTKVRLADGGRTLLLDARVPDGEHPCMRGLKAVLTDPVRNTVHVQITFTSPSGDLRSGCTKERTATTRVRLDSPLGDRELVVDNYTVFTADGARPPALRLCGQLGCTPPATGCTAASYDQALLAVGAPAHTYRNSQQCDGKWLVMDFSWRTGPVCGDGADNGCESRLGDRWFFKAEKSGWVPIAGGAAGGCRNVQRKEPGFPTSMCESLAPLSPSLHPSHPPASPSPHPSHPPASPSPSAS
ncbi:hypothetical protein [Streptomyces sp. HGB0020]|uniref:hypothetical protein n=1 Tax=Streptomyces sp. HGB0020 TaxID=1078086 RepID=UPI00034EB653|nr:hypothetical protein [Streptomyces sp. HGB0020]EPD66854.1 hypothetical protein HMPREF1211_01109 [Streptomyces sp. HGB0020]